MTIDVSRLRISVTEKPRWRRSLSVTIPSDIVRAEERRAAQALARRANLKGFRKGRVPSKLIESRFKGSLRQEALDRLIGEAFRSAVQAEELRPISEGELRDLSYEPDQDLVFEIEFDVEPTFELSRMGGFTVARPAAEVDEASVDAVLQRLREQQGVWTPRESGAPGEHDLVKVRIARLDDADTDEGAEPEGREYEFVLGQGDAIPDIEAAIRSLEVGGEGDFDVTFPDDFPAEERRGVTERVRIALLGRKTLELPELDDDFARQVGDFESLEDLRARIREDLEKEAREKADSAVRGRLLDMIVEANPFEVPDSMVDRYLEGLLGEEHGMDPQRLHEVREALRPEAERAVKRILVIERIAETQGLKATDDEIDQRIEEIAAANKNTPAEIYARLQKSGRLEMLEREITEKKVFDFLESQSEITDEAA